MEKLSKATGGNVVGNLDSLTKADLGIAEHGRGEEDR